VSRVHGAAAMSVLAMVLGLGPAVPAAAGTPMAVTAACPDPADVGPVAVTSVPAVSGLVVQVDGQDVALSDQGTATVTACRDDLVSRVSVGADPIQLDDRRRVRYDRMFVTDSGRAVALAFHVDYLTDIRLNGLPPEEIESFTLRSSTGERITSEEQAPQWLWGQRVIRAPSGLLLRDIFYTVDQVMVHGVNVVNRSQTKFYPSEMPIVQVTALTYDLDLEVRDRLFGFPVGSTAHLAAEDGTVLDVGLVSGRASLSAVPRGSYVLTVDAPGLNTPRPLSVSKDQTVDLPVLTWLDIAVLLGVPALAAALLVLVPRPRLQAAIIGRLRHPLGPRRAARRGPARRVAGAAVTGDTAAGESGAGESADVREEERELGPRVQPEVKERDGVAARQRG
jgi:hypothetical protein